MSRVRMILGIMKPLKLYWSRGSEPNAGDWFSPLICGRLSGRRIVYANRHRCDLVAVGSLLGRLGKSNRLHRLGCGRSLHIWGTGSLRPEDRLVGIHFQHALRGPLTAARCDPGGLSPKFGDPGLLAELLLDGPVAKRYRLGVIPHFVDRRYSGMLRFLSDTPHARLLDPSLPPPYLLREIARCEAVLSSGLHGLIFADALGVPNRWFRGTGNLTGGRHKFDDYYGAFGLEAHPVSLFAIDLETAFDGYSRPGIETLKQGLLESFPFR